MNYLLKTENLDFAIGDFRLEDVSLGLERGEYHVLLGPNAAGKSILLKCLLGLHRPRMGTVRLLGKDITSRPPEKRRLGYLPQTYGLFPHLTAGGNIDFAARRSRGGGGRERLLDLLRIRGLLDRPVGELSGGQRQRVALARCLAAGPEAILLDEPFSAVDEETRRYLWIELKETFRKLGVTVLQVTHSLEEAYTLGEKISVLIDGRIRQSGSREEIFQRPADPAVARYLNYRNIFSGPVERRRGGWEVDLGHFRIRPPGAPPAGGKAAVCLRPQDLKIIREDVPVRGSLQDNLYSGEIAALYPFPEYCLARFKIAGSPREWDLELKFPSYIKDRHGLCTGKEIRVAAWAPAIIVFRSALPPTT